jgi:GNAT superfamily N-acetyltransferase
MITLRQGRACEAAALSELCLRSKAFWGYDAVFMAACRQELLLTDESFANSLIEVAELAGRVVGVAQMRVHGASAELEKLFVEPADFRAGAGRALFEWVRGEAARLGAAHMTIDADPGSVEFYMRMGAVADGLVPSGSIRGRFIPRMIVELK